ncbi:MAG: dephospho-CoA kinase [Acutalibacteraceae bacterium]|nr:dephospho-CoA kinase [Acutalibacteraceae bacterium]
MKIIGLTGPTGAGKSSLKTVAENLGYKVIDCDITARKAVEKGTKGLMALVNTFGEDILFSDGSLNRKALAQKAFSTPQNTELLNKILLPFITELVLKECEGDKVLLDAPTLFESGLNEKCTATVGVLADRETRIERIKNRDNLSEDEALTRINAGKTDEFYKQNADFVIYNNGETEEFQKEFEVILSKIGEI